MSCWSSVMRSFCEESRVCTWKSPIPKPESLMSFGMDCIKSDNFRAKRHENPSESDFSILVVREVDGDQGPSADEGGLSNSAGFPAVSQFDVYIM